MDIDRIVTRAAPPPERGGDGPFEPIDTEAGSLARRHAKLHDAFGSRRKLAEHAEELGFSEEGYLKRFRDVRLVGPPPDWGCAFREIFDRLTNTDAAFAGVSQWARSCIEAEWPDGLAHRASALDGPIEHLEFRFRSVMSKSLQFENLLGAAGTTWMTRFERSPALAYALGRVMVDWRTDLLRTLRCAANDRSEISGRFFDGADPGPLVGIEAGLGDPHAGGRSVAILRFRHGSVVFKPKDLRIALAVGEIVGLLDSVELPSPSMMSAAGYAWEKEYTARPISDAQDAERFYRSLGGWLALLQALNASDFWFDNLIADAGTPRFVDFETALQPSLDWPSGVRPLADVAGVKVKMNIAGIGILPLLMPTREGVEPTDLGCLCQPGKHLTPMIDTRDGSLVEWDAHAYAPRYETGDFADIAEHFDAFEDGYLRVAGELASAELQERLFGVLEGVADAPLRVIRVDTWPCYRAIQQSLLPAVLSDGVWREIALHQALPRYAELVGGLREAAVRDMRRLDIPLFLTCPASRDLWGVDGERCRNVFEDNALSALRNALAVMGGATDEERVAWLRTAFSPRAANPPRREPIRGKLTPAKAEDLLAWADGIGTEIRDRAVRNECGYPTWIGLSHDIHWGRRFLAPLSFDVLSGRAGLALALLELGDRLGRSDLTTIAHETLCGAVRDYVDYSDFNRQLGVGHAVGAGGLLSVLTREPQMREHAEKVYRTVSGCEAWLHSGGDFVSGLAGWREAVLAFGETPPSRHGRQRPYVPSALPRLARWLDPDNAVPVCPDRSAAARMRQDRARHGSWFAERWIDERHDVSGIDGVPALAVIFAELADGSAAS